MNLTRTFNENEKEYVRFINVLTDVIRNCPNIRADSKLTGDTIMLTPFHQLTIEALSSYSYQPSNRYRIALNRIVGAGYEYLLVDDGTSRNARPRAVESALDEFYEELAFYAPDESTLETMDMADVLESLFKTYRSYLNVGYTSSFA